MLIMLRSNRWVVKYSPAIVLLAKKKRRPTSPSWRMDETYIKVKGRWCYYYRTIDKFGALLQIAEYRVSP